MKPDPAALNEFDENEWCDLTHSLWPDGYTEEDFERDWAEFQQMKRLRNCNA